VSAEKGEVSAMRMKLNFSEWVTLKLAAEWIRAIDDKFREFGKTVFAPKREHIERVYKQICDCPKRTKAAYKAFCKRYGINKYPSWLDDPSQMPKEMSLDIEGNEWHALESILCKTLAFSERPKLTEEWIVEIGFELSGTGKEQVRELLNRVLLLPRRSRAGTKSILKRVGSSAKVPEAPDLRKLEFHEGAKLLYDLEERG